MADQIMPACLQVSPILNDTPQSKVREGVRGRSRHAMCTGQSYTHTLMSDNAK